MTEPFLTTIIGSLPKPAWLADRLPFNAKGQDHHGHGQVNITLPGPMTMVDSTVDACYGDEATYALEVAVALSAEARALDAFAPAVIQVEAPQPIADRLLAAVQYHPPKQLQAAPDCGLVP
ncbi:hypothetical protein NKDENANG_01658 [Candidatus Entotheonellaceae bacterium PAL068K]